MRGATLSAFADLIHLPFQLTHPMRGATSSLVIICYPFQFQLTHPMRGATLPCGIWLGKIIISTHAPHAGCDTADVPIVATAVYFNSRTPCGVRPCMVCRSLGLAEFQLTHPMRGATAARSAFFQSVTFQLTHPMRGATTLQCCVCSGAFISTHAPHAGCD